MGIIEDLQKHRYTARKASTRIKTHGLTRVRLQRPLPGGSPQRSIVKLNYAKVSKMNAAVEYMTREGTSIESGKPELFSAKGRDAAEELAPIAGERHFFRMVISPENGNKMDLQGHARTVMEQAEKATKTKLHWVATVHNNTEQSHIHVLIRGANEKGQVRFDRDFVRQGFRNISQEAATLELGARSRAEVSRQRRLELKADRVIPLDRYIAQNQKGNTVRPTTDREQTRLNHLQNLGLARFKGSKQYQLAENWQTTLREIGYSNDVQKLMSRHLRGTDNERAKRFVYQPGEKVRGVVIAKEWDEQRSDTPYVLVKTQAGSVYFHKDRQLAGAEIGKLIELPSQTKEQEIERRGSKQPAEHTKPGPDPGHDRGR